MQVAFAGTPDFAATVLRGLISSDHEVGLVVSQPDPRKGRGRKTMQTPVAALARSVGLPLRQPTRISEVAPELSRFDALIVAAYGQILRPDTLYAATEGAWNVHASLLPKYRGAAPVERAIMNGERETGVTIMKMDEGLDTGEIALQRAVTIPPDTTGGELTHLLALEGAKAIVESLSLLEAGDLTLIQQDSLYATYAPKVTDEDKIIRWGRSAGEVHDRIRALAPHVGARAFHPGVEGPVKIWRSRVSERAALAPETGGILAENRQIVVGCGTGAIDVLELQIPGSKRLSSPDFLLGNSLKGAFLVGDYPGA
ncbi:MAG: methionyl-tRNA formyltransferase [Actinomycetota bacterium]|nr:methionyl-tRNA formyltransferase [Actinomycetota bacterium]